MSVGSSTVEPAADAFGSTATRRYRLGLVLGVLQLVVAALVWNGNVWTGAMAVFVGVSQLVVIGSIDPRIRDQSDARSVGNVVVQHSWFVLSIGVAGAAVFSSPFFSVATEWVTASVLLNLAWAVLGAYMIYWSVTEADTRATI